MIPPRLPFPDYKWRWATLTPTEGLNEPPVFLGALRVLFRNQGDAFSSLGVFQGLRNVEEDMRERVTTDLHLARSQERNIFRNSKQYWKGLGVLNPSRQISLSPLGKAVATGAITQDEFAVTVVRSLTLPNRLIENQDIVEEWEDAGLEIKPLKLILQIMVALSAEYGATEAFLTVDELFRIVIPLAGTNAPMNEQFTSIHRYRRRTLDPARWPRAGHGANDRRMAAEFLRFLYHYRFCDRDARERYLISPASIVDIATMLEFPLQAQAPQIETAREVQNVGLSVFAERKRRMTDVLARPGQARFRKTVMQAFHSRCFLTHETITETLEAAHIIPVGNSGTDDRINGLCLRSDIHSLYDAGHVRIRPNGEVIKSQIVLASHNYRNLPDRVVFPAFTSRECLGWRWKYL